MRISSKIKQVMFVVLIFFLIEHVQAQVGINTEAPAVTLDVKSSPNVRDGIIAPIVSLDKMRGYGAGQLGAIIYTDASGIGDGSTSKVTNAGYYYFDGINWQPLSANNSWQVGGNSSLPSGNNVIGTNNSAGIQIQTANSPRMTFDAAGKTIVEAAGNGDGTGSSGTVSYLQLKKLSGLQGGVPLVIDTLGNVYVQSQVAVEKVIQTTTIRLDSVNEDFVSNFDTEISSDKYTIIISSTTFSPAVYGSGISLLNDNGVEAVASMRAEAFIEGGTWRIYCDYDAASSSNHEDGAWIISMIILENSIVNMIDPPRNPRSYNLNGKSSGSPTGNGGGPVIH